MPNSADAVRYNAQRDRDVSEIVIFSLTKYPDIAEIHMEPIVLINGAKYTPPPVDVERDGKFELIGSFEIDGGNYVEYNLFVIVEPAAAGKYKAAWTWYHKGGEADLQDRTLVDAVDLDGDGTAEVIAAGHYYESNDYVIYKRQAGKWRPIYKGGGGGC